MKPADGTGHRARARGPRSDGGRAREQILDAARRRFGAHGFAGATLRAIAADAGVDVALVSYYFGSKRDLFLAALRLPLNPGDVIGGLLEGPRDDLGARIVGRLLTVWDDPATGGPLVGVLRSSATQGAILRDFIEREILARLAPPLERPG